MLRLRDDAGVDWFAYRYPQPSVTATVVVRARDTGRFLVVRRAHAPSKGQLAFAGGFMETLEETAEQAAARELLEETGIDLPPEAFRLVDARSRPDRDPRNHLVDLGYLAEAPDESARPGDDAEAVEWTTAQALDQGGLAFDHDELWRHVRQHLV